MIHIDIKTAFLNGSLEEEIYMHQPEGYKQPGDKRVCKLTRSLYGSKQASRVWNKCFTNFLKKYNLHPLYKDTCVFVDSMGAEPAKLIMAIYVDDGLICCKNKALLNEVVDHMRSRFQRTVMGVRTTRRRLSHRTVINSREM